MQIIAFAIATIIPLVFLYIIYTLDLYKTGTFRFVLTCFIWGVISVGLAYLINTIIFYNRGLASRETIETLIAPTAEEILKAAILIYLVRKPNFTYFVDGAIYGFAVGIGFAVAENYFYLSFFDPSTGLGVAVGRVLSTNLMHATTTALVGVALGLARFRRSLGHSMILAAGLILAISFHSVFNRLGTQASEGMRLIYAAILGFAGAGLIVYVIFRGLAEEKKWIEEKLGEADRVTAKEASYVQQLSNVDELLAPIANKFGAEKAEQIENFLIIQARLGILRKTLDKLNDEKMRAGVEKQMEGLRTQMDNARRAVGSYAMLYIRYIVPPDQSPLWGLIENRIQEKIAARPATGGADLFAKLGQRVSQTQAQIKSEDQEPPD
jgi:RsiW-degrading membrane proteinase PrsW (M82 family)